MQLGAASQYLVGHRLVAADDGEECLRVYYDCGADPRDRQGEEGV